MSRGADTKLSQKARKCSRQNKTPVLFDELGSYHYYQYKEGRLLPAIRSFNCFEKRVKLEVKLLQPFYRILVNRAMTSGVLMIDFGLYFSKCMKTVLVHAGS